jgi:SNF2 family DNA or RNA helicase
VQDLLRARDERGQLPPSAAPDVLALSRTLDTPPPPKFAQLAERLMGFTGVPAAALPSDLTAELRPYQRRGVDWLCFMRDAGLGALLADDMGLGKTLQALTAVNGRTLVIAPTSVVHNWLAEARRFRPGLRAALYHGPGRKLDAAAELVVTSYALLRLDVDVLAQKRWDTVVLDEAQNIKNPDSQVAQAAGRLDAGFRLALSGTPIENRLDELWSLMRFLSPGFLGSREGFAERYARPIAQGDAEVAGELRGRIKPFVLRRKKQEVAPELPPRIEVVLRCELDAEERAVYDTVRAASLANVVDKLAAGGSVLEALEALLRLRQAVCHPGLVPGQQAERSTKVDVLVETLSEAAEEGHRALVFSQWTSLLDKVEPHLRAAGLDFVRLDGATRDRAEVVARFQAADGPPVMLISLKAGGAGLNLTAADHVFLLDPWWNPAVEDQAADRAHRIGQTRSVIVHRLVAAETVEERILMLQESKRALVAAALDGEGAGVGEGLSRDDLLGLLA